MKLTAYVIFGDVNPSGKLPETFPEKLEDSLAHYSGDVKKYLGDSNLRVHYEEGINSGYRFFDSNGIEPQFPFGYSQSYTSFEYGHIQVDKTKLKGMKDHLSVSMDVTNTVQ